MPDPAMQQGVRDQGIVRAHRQTGGVPSDTTALRQDVMAVCTEATAAELRDVLARLAPLPVARDLRQPEIGLVMLRGRMGGDGAPFNLGETTVTRAAVQLETGETGFGYQLGRDGEKARTAAIIDALVQSSERRPQVEGALAPIRTRLDAERELRARRTAATRVNFFTMTRGED